ncbi:hypothetical protein [Streptomyces sp. A5-4]|uniref:hypothetical protein n=1 Tax=Streptomyces sp. A5-4 TaxID=3384771 RepID=UPI003DA8919D
MNNTKRVLAGLALAGALVGAAAPAHADTTPAGPGRSGGAAPLNLKDGAAGGLVGKVWRAVVPKPGAEAGVHGEGGVL